MKDFVHLHVHSEYSLLDGLTKLEDLVAKAKELEMPAVALTDHGSLYGAFKFEQIAKEAGIKPIIGLETYIAPNGMTRRGSKEDRRPFHLVLLAKDNTGYKNLIKITSAAHTKGFYYKPRVDLKFLRQHSAGLIALTACLKGEVTHYAALNQPDKAEVAAKKYIDIFGRENLFFELQHLPSIPRQETANRNLVALGKKLGVGLVATNDVHYLAKEDAEAHDALLCIQTKQTLDDDKRGLKMIGEDFSMRPPAEMAKQFAAVPEALTNTVKIAERCHVEIEQAKLILPEIAIPRNETDTSYLRKKAYAGLQTRLKRLPNNTEKRRLDYELKVIADKKLEPYFLMVQDFTDFMHREKIPTTTRGSAAGSFVSYALGITTANPLFFELPFERFLNPLRPKPPDIDLDIADVERDKVIRYARKKYGAENVAQIVTFGKMKAKAAVRDVGRVLGYPYDFVDKIAKMIPEGPKATLAGTLTTIPEFKQAYNSDPAIKKMIDLAFKLEGVSRHASVHAAGVVITPRPVTDYVPVQYDAQSEMILTQYEMTDLEELGLVKMDFLGLSNLSTIQKTVEILEHTKHKKIDIKHLPLDDKHTYELFSRGDTLGLFQVESAGMRKNLKQLQPDTIFDIAAMLALYRPGPMEHIPKYIANKNAPDKIQLIDQRMAPILSKSHGVITYQDDVLLIAIELGGYNWETADKFRKAMGKKIPELMAEQHDKFIKGAVANGLSRADATTLFKLMEPFAGYGFNKAHAAAYALVSYHTGYLKANYPTEFMAALLTSDQGNTDRIVLEVNECQRLGLNVLPPSVNESFRDFTVVAAANENLATSKTIRFGLAAIKNLGGNVINDIIKSRKKSKFDSIEDFMRRAYSTAMNRKSLESLIKSGALDTLGERNQLLANIETLLNFAKNQWQATASGQSDLFGGSKLNCPRLKLAVAPPAATKDILSWEKELLGLYVSSHPLADFRRQLSANAFMIKEIQPSLVGKRVRCGGIISGVRQIMTKKNKPMAFVRLEDEANEIEIVVFPDLYSKTASLWEEEKIVLVAGKVDDRDAELKILADSAQLLTKELDFSQLSNIGIAQKPKAESEGKDSTPNLEDFVYLKVPPSSTPATFAALKEILKKADKGRHRVALLLPKPGRRYQKLETDFSVNKDVKLQSQLTKVLGPNSVSK
jgi:DNA polymerase III subunit alpha